MDPSGELIGASQNNTAPVGLAGETISPSVRYYRKNRAAILAREREKKRWLDYYERNKEAVRLRQKEAYHRKKAAQTPTLPIPA